MGLPKNYNSQKPQLQKRLDSLNDLNYYEAEYMVEFKKDFLEDLDEIKINDLHHHFRYDVEQRKGLKKFSAKNREMATNVINNWLESYKKRGIIETYMLLEMTESSLYDELVEKNLLPLLDDKLFEELMDKAKMGE